MQAVFELTFPLSLGGAQMRMLFDVDVSTCLDGLFVERLELRFVQNLGKVGAPRGPLVSVCIAVVRCGMQFLIHFPFFLPGEGCICQFWNLESAFKPNFSRDKFKDADRSAGSGESFPSAATFVIAQSTFSSKTYTLHLHTSYLQTVNIFDSAVPSAEQGKSIRQR